MWMKITDFVLLIGKVIIKKVKFEIVLESFL